ncbi:hypothetical protein [Aliikangiella maris]|uniref:Uncharacterized protein n=2 Tax=Aliikangiella maris TaxID=3162458 RepID=A0ABV3MM12_9GAMM
MYLTKLKPWLSVLVISITIHIGIAMCFFKQQSPNINTSREQGKNGVEVGLGQLANYKNAREKRNLETKTKKQIPPVEKLPINKEKPIEAVATPKIAPKTAKSVPTPPPIPSTKNRGSLTHNQTTEKKSVM